MFTPVILENTYLNIGSTIPRDGDGYAYGQVNKRLRDANSIPIGKANDNPILDSIVYEVEYQDGYKAALVANVIAINIFAQVDSEENRHAMIDWFLIIVPMEQRSNLKTHSSNLKMEIEDVEKP